MDENEDKMRAHIKFELRYYIYVVYIQLRESSELQCKQEKLSKNLCCTYSRVFRPAPTYYYYIWLRACVMQHKRTKKLLERRVHSHSLRRVHFLFGKEPLLITFCIFETCAMVCYILFAVQHVEFSSSGFSNSCCHLHCILQ